MADSTVTMIGNVVRDPELRYTNGGAAIVNFGIAVNRRWQQNGEWQEQVSFFNVTCWSALAENVAASCPKGTRVVVTGRLEQREYEKKDGTKGTSVDVIADDVGASMRFAIVQIEKNERVKTDTPQKTNKRMASDEEPF